jgi:hypothetical protein
MRVTKNEKGEFAVDDEPMRLTGKAAKQFAAVMDHGQRGEAHARFLAECQREFAANRIKPQK